MEVLQMTAKAANKPANKRAPRKPKADANARPWRAVVEEGLVPINNGFGSWDKFLFGKFDAVGQHCLDMADHMSLDAAMERAGVNFEVGMTPALYAPAGESLPIPGRFATYRMDTLEVLGDVGDGYAIVQTRQAFGVAEAIDFAARESGQPGAFIGMAPVDNGRQIAAIYALPRLQLGQDEQVLPVCLIWTSHDGSRAIEVTFVPVRVACFNGNLWHVEGQSSIYRVKHTVNAENRLVMANEALSKGSDFFAAWADEASSLYAAKIDNERARDLLLQIVPDPDKTQKAQTIAERTRDAILSTYLHSTDLQNVQGTKWGLLQAVAAYVDHEHRTRVVDKGRLEPEAQADQLRFLRAVNAHPLKTAAHAVLLAA